MATLDEIRLQQLLMPFNSGNQTGIATASKALPMINGSPFINTTDQLMKFDPNIQNKSIVDQIITENQMKSNPFNSNSIQTIFPTNFPLKSTSTSTSIPFGTPTDREQGFVEGSPSDVSFSGTDFEFLKSANEDESDEEYLSAQEPSGIAKLFEFLQQFSPLRGLAALSDKLKQSSMYRPSTTGVFGYTPAQLNQMNALGGYYSEPERERRRRANRISKMLQRAAEGKSYSEKNLKNLMNQFNMGDTDTRGMIDSIKASADMGYGKGDVGQAATPGRDYSSSPGAMAGDMEYGEE